MSRVSHLVGLGSGRHYPADELMNLDPADDRPVQMALDVERLGREQPDGRWYRPDRRDMWRFGALLAMDVNDPEDARYIVTLGEGATPLYEFPDAAAGRGGFRLLLKDEGMPRAGHGANPTLSFKDRGMAMVVSQARRFGLEKLAVPTQGNAGDSLAEYALAAGLEAAIVMPDDTPMPVLGRVAALAQQHESITLELVRGTIRDAAARMRERFLPDGYFNVATFVEPGWRIEGKKTLGLELAEPRDGRKVWRLPDVIVYPTGGGTGILGMWKAFDELQALGLIDERRPRMVAVQAAATCPVVRAFERGDDDAEPVQAGNTIATGLNVAGGIGHFRVLQILRESGGAAVAVDEQAIRARVRELWRSHHAWICPEAAACFAALEPLLGQGVIHEGDEVVIVNTASLEKYLPEVRDLLA